MHFFILAILRGEGILILYPDFFLKQGIQPNIIEGKQSQTSGNHRREIAMKTMSKSVIKSLLTVKFLEICKQSKSLRLYPSFHTFLRCRHLI